MKNYRVNAESMGDGWSNADEAAKLWNKHILPVLQEAANCDECDHEPPTVSVGHGRAAYADDWAWEEFCGREAGEDESVCIALAEELREKLK